MHTFSSLSNQSTISGILQVVQGDVAEVDPWFHPQHNILRRLVSHEHESLSSPRTCQCFENVSLPGDKLIDY